MSDFESKVETARIKYHCDVVLSSGWNFMATDHRLLVQLYHKHGRQWPAAWRWGWATAW